MISTLAQATPIATVPVRNLDAAARFYEQVLGLTRDPMGSEGVVSFKAGSTNLLVYESPHAGTNEATAVTWTGLDVDAVVKALRDKQVRFEHYTDMPDTKLEGDVHVSGEMRVAWFKDPDGNIHALVN